MPSSGNSGSGGPVFGVPLSQCVEATPWRKRSACTSTSTTGIDIPEITSPTASKASRSDSRISVGSTISVQDRVNAFSFFLNISVSKISLDIVLSKYHYIISKIDIIDIFSTHDDLSYLNRKFKYVS